MSSARITLGERALALIAAAALAAAVAPWLVGAWGPLPQRSLFHIVGAGQGFVGCLLGALTLATLPRLTGRPVAGRRALVAVVAAASLGVLGCAWLRRALPNDILLGVAEGLALLSVLAAAAPWAAALARGFPAGTPASLLWLPVALVAGATGGALVSASTVVELTGGAAPWLVPAGRAALLQAAPLAVLLAAAPFALGDGRARGGWPAQAACALALLATLPLELAAPRLGLGLRGLAAAAPLLLALPSGPRRRSPLERALAAGCWSAPLAYALATAAPGHRVAALHLLFLGGFVMAPLAGLLVADGRTSGGKLGGASLAALGAALALRAAADLPSAPRPALLAASALALLAALAAWAAVWLHGGEPGERPA